MKEHILTNDVQHLLGGTLAHVGWDHSGDVLITAEKEGKTYVFQLFVEEDYDGYNHLVTRARELEGYTLLELGYITQEELDVINETDVQAEQQKEMERLQRQLEWTEKRIKEIQK